MSLVESLLKKGAEQYEQEQTQAQAQADVQQSPPQVQEQAQSQAQADGVDHTISSISVGQDGQDEQQASESLTLVEKLLQQGAQQVINEEVTDEQDTQPAEQVTELDEQTDDVVEPFNDVVAGEQAQADTQAVDNVADDVADEMNEVLQALEKEREEIANERAAFQRQLHELQTQLTEARQQAAEAERDKKRVHLSHALINRDDIVDVRIVSQLINVDELDSDDLAHSITQKVNEVLRSYPTLAVDDAKQYITRDVDGLKVQKEVKPIGKPMGQSDRDNGANKATELEKLRKRAIRSGSEVDRVAYAKAKRALGMIKEVGRR